MNNTCTGCGLVFPLKQGPGDCLKCSLLEKIPRNSEQYAITLSYPQCRGCGITRRHGTNSASYSCGADPCNEILNLDSEPRPDGLLSTSAVASHRSNIPATHDELARRTRARFGVAAPPASSQMPAAQVAQIQQKEQASRSLEYNYTVHWQANFIDKAVKFGKNFGSFMLSPKGSVYMDELKKQMLNLLNVQRNKDEVHEPILLSETCLRFHQGRNPIEGTEYLKLEEFYMRHSNSTTNIETYVNNLPKHIGRSKSQKDRVIYLELIVNTPFYDKRIKSHSELSEENSLASISIRKRTVSSSIGLGLGAKRTKSTNLQSSSTLRSTYKPLASTAQQNFKVSAQSSVNFKRIDIKLDAEYQPKFVSCTSETIAGLLDDAHFAQGSMKLVFDLQLGSREFVAKRYNKFSDMVFMDSEKLSENRKLISLDAGRLVQCQAFMDSFYRHADKSGVEGIDRNIRFSKCFLLEEMGFGPSKASGIEYIDAGDSGLTWLIEPKRSPVFEKFTGTMVHTRSFFGGLTSETVHAFAHFVYRFTEENLVVADLQGTLASADGKNTLVLFDPMTHTRTGTSGCGDHGQEGIDVFVKDHVCGPVCNAMGLNDGAINSEGVVDSKGPVDDSSDSDDEDNLPAVHSTQRGRFDPIRDA